MCSRPLALFGLLGASVGGCGGAASAPVMDGSSGPTGKNVLMVLGDGNETNPVSAMGTAKGTGPGNVFLKNRLQNVLGHKVTMVADTTAKPMLLQAANSAALVIVCESVLSGNILTALNLSTTPIVSYEAGMPPAFTYGTLVADHMDIVNPIHPLAAGLSSGTFRRSGHRNYRDCGDQFLRNLLKGLSERERHT
jgi:hypothetical protein